MKNSYWFKSYGQKTHNYPILCSKIDHFWDQFTPKSAVFRRKWLFYMILETLDFKSLKYKILLSITKKVIAFLLILPSRLIIRGRKRYFLLPGNFFIKYKIQVVLVYKNYVLCFFLPLLRILQYWPFTAKWNVQKLALPAFSRNWEPSQFDCFQIKISFLM